MDSSDIIIKIAQLIDNSLLPELLKDIGTSHIEANIFDHFRITLDINLIRLFDLLQHHEYLLDSIENGVLQLKSRLILLTCEQTLPNALYQTRNKSLVENFNTLAEKHFLNMLNKDHKIETEVMKYYQSKLKQDVWKKNIGSACGFLRFLELRYSKNKFMDIPCSTFVLSVGLLLRDYYDPFFKGLGIQMFRTILKSSPKDQIKEMNIHRVIYDGTFQDITKFDDIHDILNVWDCLYDCIILIDQEMITTHKWSEVDTFLKALIDQINFAKSVEIWLNLFQFIPKICLCKLKQEETITEIMNNTEIDGINKIIAIRDYCVEPAPIAYRWVKTLLDFFIAESNYLMGTTDTALDVLHMIHITYLICIFPMKLSIIEPHLVIFWDKFVLVLMEMFRTHKNDPDIKLNIEEFLQTFVAQLNMSDNGGMEFREYINNFNKILVNLFVN